MACVRAANCRSRDERQFAERSRKAGENRLKFADKRAKQADAVAQRLINIGFDRIFIQQIDDTDSFKLLSKAIDTPDPLFHLHGVPGHVVVDKRSTELEVETFSRGIRT